MQDAIVDAGGNWGIRLNIGGRFGAVFGTGISTGPEARNFLNALVLDFNSDGRQDMFAPISGVWRALRATPNGTSFEVVPTPIPETGYNDQPQVGDFNGDGLLDIALAANNVWKLYLHKSGMPNLITSITSGGVRVNDRITVAYASLTDPSIYTLTGEKESQRLPCALLCPRRGFIAPMHVTSSHAANNGLGGMREYTYSYEDAQVDIAGRGFLGFAKQTVRDVRGDPADILTVNTYVQNFQNFTLHGLPESTEVRLSTGRVLSRVTDRYLSITTTTSATVPMFPYLSSSVVEKFDLFSGDLLSTTTTTNTVDNQFGNIDETTVRIRDVDGTLVHETRTVNLITNNPTTWRLGRLRRSEVTQTSDQQTLTRVANFGYDDGSTDLLNQETVETGTAFALPKQYERDLFGNVTKETVSVSPTEDRATETTYNANGRFAETVKNAEGHTERYVYDPYHGGIQRLKGPNLLDTVWTYDALGRKASEVRADGTTTNISYAWCVDCPSATAVYKITTTSTGAPTITEYFDSLNRNVLTQTESFDGRPSNVLTQYTPRGEVLRVSRPYFPGASVFFTEYDYDILGRVIKEDSPVTGSAAISYTGLITTTARTVTKSVGITTTQRTQEIKDERGLTTETVQVNEGISTEYRYDPAGNLIEVADSAGNLTTNVYDVRGHKVQTIDPDMGHWFYTYNALGELIEQRDAKNQITKFFYDKLGHLRERQEPEGTKTRISTWVYDTAIKGIGKLASETSRLGTTGSVDFRRTYTYDNLSRPASTVTAIGSTSYGTSLSYDAASRVEVNAAQPESITRSVHEKPNFTAGTAGKVMFGLLGALAMIRAGNRIVADNEIEDPAVYIGKVLADGLSESYGLRINEAKGEMAESESVSELSEQYQAADLLLDVRTVNWSFIYFPTDWNNYRVIYSTKLLLIDTRASRIMAEGFCIRNPDQTDDAPSHEQLLENRAARLKEELQLAADFCIDELKTKVLRL